MNKRYLTFNVPNVSCFQKLLCGADFLAWFDDLFLRVQGQLTTLPTLTLSPPPTPLLMLHSNIVRN